VIEKLNILQIAPYLPFPPTDGGSFNSNYLVFIIFNKLHFNYFTKPASELVQNKFSVFKATNEIIDSYKNLLNKTLL